MHIVESCGFRLRDEHLQCDGFSCSARGRLAQNVDLVRDSKGVRRTKYSLLTSRGGS
jgi:hypothetical protein